MGTVLSGCRSLRGSDRPPISKDRILPADTGTNPYTSADIVTGNPFTAAPRALERKPAIPGCSHALVREFRDVRGKKGLTGRNGFSAGPLGARPSRSRQPSAMPGRWRRCPTGTPRT